MSNVRKKIVIYGGAFNPPHVGHAAVIETAIRLFLCDELWIMPTANRRDKITRTKGVHRIRMLKIMKRELFSSFRTPIKISNLELNRPRLTTTYDTKLELENAYPQYEFYFLLGSDIVGDIEKKWVDGKKLFQNGKFIVFKRSSNDVLKKMPPQTVVLEKDVTCLEFSSTFIRNLLKRGDVGTPYISPGVARYIKENKLYH